MKKIGLYLQSHPACGGVNQYNLLMLEALTALAIEYNIVVFYGNAHWEAILKDKNLKIKHAYVGIFWRLAKSLWKHLRLPLIVWRKLICKIHPVARKMVKEKCDIWIFPTQDDLAYWIPIKALSTIHDLMHRYERQFKEVGNKSEFKNREFHFTNICKWSKGILVDSNLGKDQVIESYGISPSKCHVLPYISRRTDSQVSSIDFHKKYNLPEKFLFYPAQFWEHKNHKNLLLALAESRKIISDIHLVLVGSPKNNHAQIIHMINDLELNESVKVYDFIPDDDIPEFFKRARALIMPTFFGPTNIPPLEAFALGCPVTISGIYGMKEQLKDAALYFNPKSINEISLCINRVWQEDDLCQSLVLKGKQRNNDLSFDYFTNTLKAILNKTLIQADL